MKSILVAIDFEDKSDKLIEKALMLAGNFNAKIWIVHVAAPQPDFVGYEVGPQYIRDTRAEELREEHRLIQRYVNVVTKRGFECEGLLIQGATIKSILQESAKLNNDLIIIGYHERSLISEALIGGSTAFEITRKSEIPVLIVPIR